MTMDECVDLHG